MNKIKQHLVAKELYEKYCMNCDLYNDNICHGGFQPEAHPEKGKVEYKRLIFSYIELEHKRCFSYEKKEESD